MRFISQRMREDLRDRLLRRRLKICSRIQLLLRSLPIIYLAHSRPLVDTSITMSMPICAVCSNMEELEIEGDAGEECWCSIVPH